MDSRLIMKAGLVTLIAGVVLNPIPVVGTALVSVGVGLAVASLALVIFRGIQEYQNKVAFEKAEQEKLKGKLQPLTDLIVEYSDLIKNPKLKKDWQSDPVLEFDCALSLNMVIKSPKFAFVWLEPWNLKIDIEQRLYPRLGKECHLPDLPKDPTDDDFFEVTRKFVNEAQQILPAEQEINDSDSYAQIVYTRIQKQIAEIKERLEKREKQEQLLSQIKNVISALKQQGITPKFSY